GTTGWRNSCTDQQQRIAHAGYAVTGLGRSLDSGATGHGNRGSGAVLRPAHGPYRLRANPPAWRRQSTDGGHHHPADAAGRGEPGSDHDVAGLTRGEALLHVALDQPLIVTARLERLETSIEALDQFRRTRMLSRHDEVQRIAAKRSLRTMKCARLGASGTPA